MHSRQTAYPWKGKISLDEFKAKVHEFTPRAVQHFEDFSNEIQVARELGDEYDSVKCGHRNLMRSTIEALNKDWRELRQMSVDLTTNDVVARFLTLTRSADMLSKEASKKSLKFFSLSNMFKSDKRKSAEERAEHVQRVKEALDLFPGEMKGEMWWVQDLRRHYEDRLNSMEEAYKDLESKEWAKLDGTSSKPPKTWKIE